MGKKLLHVPLPVEVFLGKTPEQAEEVPAKLIVDGGAKGKNSL